MKIINNLRKILGANFLLLSALYLLSCSGENNAPLTSVSISGVAADGYLRHAKAFLDCDNDRVHDAGELSAETKEGGKYTIEGESPCSDFTVVIDASDVDKVKDEDFMDSKGNYLTLRQAGITNGYVLTAPKGKEKFISPFSTLLSETDLSKEELLRLLGIESGDEDFFEDYVEKKSKKKKRLLAKSIVLVLDKYLNKENQEGKRERIKHAITNHIDDIKKFTEDMIEQDGDHESDFFNKAKETGFAKKVDDEEDSYTVREKKRKAKKANREGMYDRSEKRDDGKTVDDSKDDYSSSKD